MTEFSCKKVFKVSQLEVRETLMLRSCPQPGGEVKWTIIDGAHLATVTAPCKGSQGVCPQCPLWVEHGHRIFNHRSGWSLTASWAAWVQQGGILRGFQKSSRTRQSFVEMRIRKQSMASGLLYTDRAYQTRASGRSLLEETSGSFFWGRNLEIAGWCLDWVCMKLQFQ